MHVHQSAHLQTYADKCWRAALSSNRFVYGQYCLLVANDASLQHTCVGWKGCFAAQTELTLFKASSVESRAASLPEVPVMIGGQHQHVLHQWV